ncbi:GcrA family cell cycle regulator [Nonomuraea sp. CA-141351]|uniref:GcrA family cell cycle regulator n=1 Tax=Nonomuraea sp. CA-141351 TaxID=3239996 RepID=UPI003D948DC4
MPPRGPAIDRDRLLELLQAGLSYSEIAEQLGASYSGVAHAVKRMGLSRKQLTHSDAIPWTVKEEHKRTAPLQYMRELSQMAKGKMISAHRQATAIRWAQGLVEQGLDVSYDPDAPPSDFCPQGGFHLIPADEGTSHVAGLLEAASQKVAQ